MPSNDVLVSGGQLLVPGEDHGLYVKAGDLAIRSGRLLAVGDLSDLPEDFAPQMVDAKGCAVMPGLVNTHGHAAMSLLRGFADDMALMPWLEEKIWPVEAHMTAEDIFWGTQLAAVEMLRGGITTFADMYMEMDAVAEAATELGMRAVLSVGLIGVTGDAQAKLHTAEAFFQRWHGTSGGRIQVQLGPHAPYTCPPDFLKEVIALKHALGAGVHIHVAETQGEVDQMIEQYGCSPVQWLHELGLFEQGFATLAHSVHVATEDLALLRAYPVGIAHCPVSNQRLASGVAPVVEMLDAGITVGLGTDGPASTGALDLWEHMRSAAFQQKIRQGDPAALPAPKVLYMATAGGARALGLLDTGQLTPGFRADVLIVDLEAPHLTPIHDLRSTLAYAARASDVRDVWIDGVPRLRNRELTRVNEAEILANSRRVTTDLLQRAGIG